MPEEPPPTAADPRQMPFVAPCRDGAVCALGSDAWLRADFDELEQALARLSLSCDEAAWFGMDASRSRFGWALARGGVVLRAWCGDGDDEAVLWSVGSPTGDERALGFFVDDPRDGIYPPRHIASH